MHIDLKTILKWTKGQRLEQRTIQTKIKSKQCSEHKVRVKNTGIAIIAYCISSEFLQIKMLARLCNILKFEVVLYRLLTWNRGLMWRWCRGGKLVT